MFEHIDDTRIWKELDASAAGRMMAWLDRRIRTASVDSSSVSRMAAARTQWHAAGPSRRLTAIGAAVLAAVFAHLPMQLLQPPVGWWWLIVPGLATLFGFVAVLTGLRARE